MRHALHNLLIGQRRPTGFTLVEVVLALGVISIGLVAVLGMLPVGLRASRGASDDTQMAQVGQDFISYYQQLALTSANYNGANVLAPMSYTTNWLYEVIPYHVHVDITGSGFPQMTNGNTNLLSRVSIFVWRFGSKTNIFVTEVARYALP